MPESAVGDIGNEDSPSSVVLMSSVVGQGQGQVLHQQQQQQHALRPSSSFCSSLASDSESGMDSEVEWDEEPPEGGYNDGDEAAVSVPGAYMTLRDKIHERIKAGDKFFSLEFFPPRTKAGAVNLLSMFERMGSAGALFIDVTWHPAGNPAGETETSSMGIANAALNYCGLETMLHMTCLGKTPQVIGEYLEKAKRLGVRNVLALRGDPIPGGEPDQPDTLHHAVDLVKLIRQTTGRHFVIGVAGYPCGHPEAESYEKDLEYLKEKVDAGADLVITQLFFKAEHFVQFEADCRRVGITVPIIPGVMPIQSYDSLRHIVKLSKLQVPDEIKGILEPLKWNHEAIRNFGIRHAVDMIRTLFRAGVAPGVHLYTLNREVASERILKEVGLWDSGPQRCLPWKTAANVKRCKEDVRPIFWARRPKSYVYRTQKWDEFPNGRWGNSQSPAFGELKDYYLFYLKNSTPKEELLSMWGERLTCEKDVWGVFERFISGEINEHGVKVTTMPWSDAELEPETFLLKDKLAELNRKGILTINSQPSVNGMSSEDPTHGWGPKGGYVYQKAYLEFFTAPDVVDHLLALLPAFPTVNFHVIDKRGRVNLTNINKHRCIAVTWGVFPGMEIVQPTVVDPRSFKVWKDEAFELWTEQWGKLYPGDSESSRLIESIANSYLLVNLVDNEYIQPTRLWELLDAVLQRKAATSTADR